MSFKMDYLKTVFMVLTVLCFNTHILGQSARYEEKYITLPVDHFTFTTDKTFQLRYFINDTFSSQNPDAPILFYCGNEADIEIFAKSIGFIWEFAAKINALVIFAEHRYYGKSLPFGNSSMEGRERFGFLTIEQALADFAALVNDLNKDASRNRPTIAIGGSYGGILAALFRIKYPHLIAGALAASAPLKQFSNLTPCDEYSKTITRTFHNAYNEHCTSNIKKSWTVFRDVAHEPDGVQFFNTIFGFCEPWKAASSVENLLDTMSNVFWRMSMWNYPYEADVYMPLPANPVEKFCSHLGVEYNGRELIKAFRKALEVYTNFAGKNKCFEFPSRELMQPYEVAAWTFQTCTELLTAMCDREGKDNMFPPGGGENYEQRIDGCREGYGIRVDYDINRIKNHFGVDSLKSASNIIFSNGLLDPWSAASVLSPPNDRTLVVNITMGAHHLDLRYSNEKDPSSVTQARLLEQLYLKKWIRDFRREKYHFM